MPEGKHCTNKCLMCVHRIQFSRSRSFEPKPAERQTTVALPNVFRQSAATNPAPVNHQCADSVTSTAVYHAINRMSSSLLPPDTQSFARRNHRFVSPFPRSRKCITPLGRCQVLFQNLDRDRRSHRSAPRFRGVESVSRR